MAAVVVEDEVAVAAHEAAAALAAAHGRVGADSVEAAEWLAHRLRLVAHRRLVAEALDRVAEELAVAALALVAVVLAALVLASAEALDRVAAPAVELLVVHRRV